MAARRYILIYATLAIWFVAWAVWTADALVEPVSFVIERAARRLPLCLFGAVLCLGLGHLLSEVRRRLPRLLIPVLVTGIIVCSLAFASVSEIVFYVIAPRWGPSRLIHIPDVAMLVGWVFLAWTLLYFALVADAERRDRALEVVSTEAAALDAQHQLLVHQAQPHFIFNTLNTIYALSLDDNAAGVRSAILTLSNYLRRSLSSPSATTTLGEELAVVRDYLAIEKLRFGDRLIVRESIAETELGATVPSLILQPLVENSIKHGLAGTSEPVTITIGATTENSRHLISVDDDATASGVGMGTGIGLASVRRRVAAWGDGSGHVRAGRMETGFRTVLDLPVMP